MPSALNCVQNMLNSINVLFLFVQKFLLNLCNLQGSRLVKIKAESIFFRNIQVNTLNIKLLQDIFCVPMLKGVP